MIVKGGRVLPMAKKWLIRPYSRVTSELKPVVGLEVHLQISSKSKLFSTAPTAQGASNNHVSLFDAAIPGTLPVLNRRCVEAAVQAAVALNCEQINNEVRFDRKHYFYADMPAGFQITQQFHPIARKGKLVFYQLRNGQPVEKECRIHQIQLEQDSGKSIHDINSKISLVDLNRAGIGLLEIVFEPDLTCGEEAAALVKELVAIVKQIGICSGRMDQGALRVDANVSVHEEGTPLGTRTEIKNLNSLRSVSRAINFEIGRQKLTRYQGFEVKNVTMRFDTETMSTIVMRDKEVLQDYRFFPEPNIPMVDLEASGINVEQLAKELPALPSVLRQKLIDEFDLQFWQSLVLLNEPGFHQLFQDVMKLLDNKELANKTCTLIITDILGYLNENDLELRDCSANPLHIAKIITMSHLRKATPIKIREILHKTLSEGSEPESILKENNWKIIQDDTFLNGLCDEVITLYPNECNKIAKGQERHMNKLLAHIRKASDNRADMKIIRKILAEKLSKSTNTVREEIHIGR